MESEHKESIQLAGSRVRKYNIPNLTEVQMLHYTLDLHLFDAIADIINKGSCLLYRCVACLDRGS